MTFAPKDLLGTGDMASGLLGRENTMTVQSSCGRVQETSVHPSAAMPLAASNGLRGPCSSSSLTFTVNHALMRAINITAYSNSASAPMRHYTTCYRIGSFDGRGREAARWYSVNNVLLERLNTKPMQLADHPPPARRAAHAPGPNRDCSCPS